ncbi:MAG: serine/threonine protein kinase [Saprospiraceae bacterium]|nr:serine/threonine protein kinase [Pyrinomonadaceae bacterium]
MIEAGKILQQRYRIDKQIGQGGMGAVYVATDERFGSIVAIKETLCMDDNYRKAIEREARLLNSLKHTALPRVSDHFLEENGQFLVMEYIPGEDLGCMMERDEKIFAVDEILTWADQLLDALDFLHNQENPVIHRDIKPQNLKINSRGQIILLDFGLAKGNPTDAGHNTAAKSIFGYSRNYASLEQIQGTGTDPRSDLYSLAATLYHLLTGVPPEDALTRAMSVLSAQADPLMPAHLVRSDIPKGFSGILQNALDLNASQRPVSAAAMRTMLGNYSIYEHFADVNTGMAARIGDDILSQKTQLLPNNTAQVIDKQTTVKTEMMPGYISQQTAVRTGDSGRNTGSKSPSGLLSGSPSESRRSRRPLAIAATLAGSLLLAGSVGAGVYLYDPAIFGSGTEADIEPEKISGVTVVDQDNSNITNANSVPVIPVPPEETAGRVQVNESRSSETDPKITDTAKGGKTPATGKKQKPVGSDTMVDGETVYVGNMKITNGRVETPDTIIDENGIRPQVPNAMPPVMPPNLRNLTPAQRRRLRMRQQNMPPNYPAEKPKY